MTDRVDTSLKGDQRARVLQVLVERANPKGYVKDMDVLGIARLTGIDTHDVVKQLWGMQKQGTIGFSTRSYQGRNVPYRFRLTKGAMQEMRPEPTERPSEAPEQQEGTQMPGQTQPATEPGGEALAILAVPPGEQYPMIADLFARRERVRLAHEAAIRLEQAGLDDLAVQTLDAVPGFSPLEKEIMALVEDWSDARRVDRG